MTDPVEEYVAGVPAAAVRPYVKRYIGYRLTGFSAGLHRGFPSQDMTFIASIGQPIHVAVPQSSDQSPGKYRSVVAGLHSSPALIAHNGNQEGVTMELTPLGSRSLLGIPAREVCDLSLELSDVVGPAGEELWERLQPVLGWEERFRICDEVLTRMVRGTEVAAELGHAWDALVASQGRLRVSDLAREVGYSRQHLGRLFRDEFGISPKLASRVIRFGVARRMMTSVPSFISIAQVAAACGYSDQSHLNRDFIELGGCTPTELFDDLPFFQDDGVIGSEY